MASLQVLQPPSSGVHDAVGFCCAVQDFFGRWGGEGVVELKTALSELTVKTASRTLLGAGAHLAVCALAGNAVPL